MELLIQGLAAMLTAQNILFIFSVRLWELYLVRFQD